jgi:hypothetical protein
MAIASACIGTASDYFLEGGIAAVLEGVLLKNLLHTSAHLKLLRIQDKPRIGTPPENRVVLIIPWEDAISVS